MRAVFHIATELEVRCGGSCISIGASMLTLCSQCYCIAPLSFSQFDLACVVFRACVEVAYVSSGGNDLFLGIFLRCRSRRGRGQLNAIKSMPVTVVACALWNVIKDIML